MSQPLSGLQYDRFLTSVVIAYQNEALVAERTLFPVTMTPGYKGQFRKISPTMYLQDNSGPLSPESPTEYVDQESSLDRYLLKRYALAGFVPRALEEESQNMTDLMRETAEDVQDRVLSGKEREAATLAQTASNYGTTFTPSAKWDNFTTNGGDPASDILDQIEAVRKKIGMKPNRLQMPEATWTRIRRNPKLLNLQSDTDRGYITLQAFANIIGIPVGNITIAGALTNTSPEGVDANLQDIWGDYVMLVRNDRGRRVMRWAACFKPQVATQRMRVRRWQTENPLGMNVEVQHRYQLKVIEPDAGCLISDVLT